jgi:hypothetical protein
MLLSKSYEEEAPNLEPLKREAKPNPKRNSLKKCSNHLKLEQKNSGS